MREAKKYYRIVCKAEDVYLPKGPPYSPLTPSYFTMWAMFDVQSAIDKDTMGGFFVRIGPQIGLPAWLCKVIGRMRDSRMGYYLHCGLYGSKVLLSEVGTTDIIQCHCTSGYVGEAGEIWYARILPPPNGLLDYHVVFGTPYHLVDVSEQAILEYVARELERMQAQKPLSVDDPHGYLMKYGPDPNHWNEYIFAAYCGSEFDVIHLTGIPDIKESLPHA